MSRVRAVNRPFTASGIHYLPGDTYVIAGVMSTDDEWLEATRSITTSDGGVDETHVRCLVLDWEARLMLHSRICPAPDTWIRDLT